MDCFAALAKTTKRTFAASPRDAPDDRPREAIHRPRRHCERSEAIHLATVRKNGLLRCARNDGLSAMAQHTTLSVVIARQQVRATRGPMTGSGVIRRLEDGPSIT